MDFNKHSPKGFSKWSFKSLSFRRKKREKVEISSAPTTPSVRAKLKHGGELLDQSPIAYKAVKKWSNLTDDDDDEILSTSGEYINMSSKKKESATSNLFSKLSLIKLKQSFPESSASSTWQKSSVLSFNSHSNLDAQDELPITEYTDDRDDEEEGPNKIMVVAQHPFHGQMECDLTFEPGDEIEVLTQTMSQFDWWEGRLGDKVGIFPANYVTASL